MSSLQWFAIVAALSAGVIALDVKTGPYVLFPILFVIPIGLAAWFIGLAAGLGVAVSLVAAKFWVTLTFEHQFMPPWADTVNTGIRLLVFVGLAYMISRIAAQKRELEQRVEELEGILPICSFCKKIRDEDGRWEQVESYVSHRSAAEFSHSVCTDCEKEHYGEHRLAGHR